MPEWMQIAVGVLAGCLLLFAVIRFALREPGRKRWFAPPSGRSHDAGDHSAGGGPHHGA